ncbi:hypothetical protein LTR08_005005 [Meristemomyces frigidus]|nr:hypothetical protein LTR08_005005 [Meristemomyces frigidus]
MATLALDPLKPSLFELLAEAQLHALIPPSLRYLLALATYRHPRYLLRILNSFDELYALLALVVEGHYLRTHFGAFTENFYGLKRERVLATTSGEVRRAQHGAPEAVRQTLTLRRGDVWRNLAVLVLLPYLKRKLDESYDVHAASLQQLLGPGYRARDRYPTHGTLRARLFWLYKSFLRRVYPAVNAAYYSALLAFNLAYLFDASAYHSPFLALVGTRMRRLNEADARAIALATAPPSPAASRAGAQPGHGTSLFAPRSLAQTVYPRLLSSLKILLPTSIFALKFLEWWHASDFARQLSRKANEGLQLPPPLISAPHNNNTTKTNNKPNNPLPPPPPPRHDSALSTPPISTLTHLPILTVPPPSPTAPPHCPICTLTPIQTPTAAQTGHVYCYACIHQWVAGTHARQEDFMRGGRANRGADDDDDDDGGEAGEGGGNAWVAEGEGRGGGSREGLWESGAGRDAVTGRRVLGGAGGLRRVMV